MLHASHPNAALTPRARLRLGSVVIEQGWACSRAARRFEVDPKTVRRWADRYAAVLAAGRVPALEDMQDRSSRPHRQPTRTPARVVRRIVRARRRRLGPVEIGQQLGLPASTVHAVLVRCRLHRLSHLDRVTGEPVRRYEHDQPGALIHVDVKKLGNIPDGGGWRHVGRVQGEKHRAAMANAGKAGRDRHYGPKLGTAFVHTVIDDHSRVAYAEIHDDETAATATAVLRRAVAWYAARGVRVERVLSDNGSAYKSHTWRHTCAELGIKVKKTRPYRPQTNGKICEDLPAVQRWPGLTPAKV